MTEVTIIISSDLSYVTDASPGESLASPQRIIYGLAMVSEVIEDTEKPGSDVQIPESHQPASTKDYVPLIPPEITETLCSMSTPTSGRCSRSRL